LAVLRRFLALSKDPENSLLIDLANGGDAAADPQQYYAAVDLGSNSFHMVLARQLAGKLQIIDRLRDGVRLSAGLDAEDYLSLEVQERGLTVLERFGQRLRGLPSGNVRVIGTYTLRRATNTHDFLERAYQALGHPVEVVSGQEEARLIYSGVNFTQGIPSNRRLVFDIGGGSSELAAGSGDVPSVLESLHLGCVSYSQEFFADGQITARNWKRAVTAARLEIQPIQREFINFGWDEVVGTSGSIRAVHGVLQAAGLVDSQLTATGMDALPELLQRVGQIDKLTSLGGDMTPERAAVFVGGAVILKAAFEAFKFSTMNYCDGALREGVLAELLGTSPRREDVCRHTVDSLTRLYHIDSEHGRRVAETAAEIFDQLPGEMKDREELRDLLLWSAELHEVGLAVSHVGYHKHGHYLLVNSDLAGFSRADQTLMALLVRSHRRSIVAKEFKSLPTDYQKWALRLTVLLRLAALLHRARVPDPMPSLQIIKATEQSLEVKFSPNWLTQHPLTLADLHAEVVRLKQYRFDLKF